MPRLSRLSRGLLIALALAVAACSGAPETEEDSRGESPSGSVEGSAPQPPSADQGTDEEPSGSDEITGDWRVADLDDVEVEREIHPDEWVEVTVACVREQGFPAEPNRGGGVSFQGASEEQAPFVEQVSLWCEARFPIEERYTQPLDDEQIRMSYRYLVEEAVPCIEEQGYQTPEPPSEETYVANYGSSDAPQWIPFPRSIPQDDWHDLIEACPRSLPVDELYPDE